MLGGADSPAAVLEHLTRTHGGQAELQERVAGRWIRAASSGVDGQPARGVPHRHPRRPDPAVHRAVGLGHARPAGRVRRPGRGGPGPGAAAHPGRPGRGAGRGQPDADRAARGGQPRPAHAARVDQGQCQQPAADRRGVVAGRPGRPARDHRAERRPAGRPDRQPARHEPPAYRVPAALPAPHGDRRGGPGRAARARRPLAAGDGRARRLPAGAGRSGPARAGPGQLVLQRAAALPAPRARPSCRRSWPADMVVLAVVDHGPGVPDEAKERIFEPFTRVGDRSPRRRPRPGRGPRVRRGHGRPHRGRGHTRRRAHGGHHPSRRRSVPTSPRWARGRDPGARRRRRALPSCGPCGSTSAPASTTSAPRSTAPPAWPRWPATGPT